MPEEVTKAERPKHWARAMVDAQFERIGKAEVPSTAITAYRDRTESTLGHTGAMLGTGLVLGTIDAVAGPEPGGHSVDGWMGFVSVLSSWGLSEKHPAASSYARTVGAVSLGGWGRRKWGDWLRGMLGGGEDRREPEESRAPATPEEDEIVKFARSRTAT